MSERQHRPAGSDGTADRPFRTGAVLDDVKAYFAGGARHFAPPTEEFVDESWFDVATLEGLEVESWHWVNEPFAFVVVHRDEDAKEYRYRVVEPTMDEFERYVREDLTTVLRNSLVYLDLEPEDDREAVFSERAIELMADHAATVDDGTLQKTLYYLLRDFLEYGAIDPMMRDRNIEDVSCDGSDVPVYVYHREYRDLRTNVAFDRRRLNSMTVRLAQRAGKQISVSSPLVDASLPDGSRIQLTLGGEVSTRGSNFTIRKFADIPYTPVDLINWNTFSVDQMAYFWLVIENNRSLLFAGGTGSGKTTSLNAVSFFIPPTSKVVSIEDTREIDLPHDNWIQSVTRSSASGEGRGEVSIYNLLQSALRQRPEYLLVGEIRTEQNVALTFFQAMGTGHTAYTTIHADSVETVLSRLQNPPLSIPTQMLQDLDVVNVQRQTFVDDRRVRRNVEVSELAIDPTDVDRIATNDVFEWDPRSDVHEQVGDSHVLTGIADDRGWTDDELEAELQARRDLLQYLIDNEIYAYEHVAAAIHTFQKDDEFVRDRIETGTFDPAEHVTAVADPETVDLDASTWQKVVASAGSPDVAGAIDAATATDGHDSEGADVETATFDGTDGEPRTGESAEMDDRSDR